MTFGNEQQPKKFVIFCDGASNPKTQRAGIGAVWFHEMEGKDYHFYCDKIPFMKLSREIFECKGSHPTNNEAEYQCLIESLKLSIQKGMKDVVIFMDSKLVVNQVNGLWKINFAHLQKLKQKVDEISKDINFTLHHVRREYNKLADQESKNCLKRPKSGFFDNWKSN